MSIGIGERTVQSGSAAETEAIGEAVASELSPGDVILVEGELGAGKTTLIRGICRGLGVAERVTSPTFTIGQTYEGRATRIAHLDLYRLEGLGGEDPGLLDDYLTANAIALVEWPAAGGGELRERATLSIEIADVGESRRELRIRPESRQEAC